jgi:hypothetical protein
LSNRGGVRNGVGMREDRHRRSGVTIALVYDRRMSRRLAPLPIDVQWGSEPVAHTDANANPIRLSLGYY